MALKHVMINDIIAEHSARMQNLRKYYPFFALSTVSFSQYKDGRYEGLDMGYIVMATLRFFIDENSFREKDVTYEEYEDFLQELLCRDFQLEKEDSELSELISYIFDKIKNDGHAFAFPFYDPEAHESKVTRVRLIDSHIVQGKVCYFITPEAIEFYLDTKEIKDESKINVSQLLLEKMIHANNFKGGIDVVRRINSQVNALFARKEQVIALLSADVFEGAKSYEEFMDTCAKWFSEEQKLFVKNKTLIDKAIEKAEFDPQSKAFSEISRLETELKKTIYNHSRLIGETAELSRISDRIISRAKLRKLRPVFDFKQSLQTIMKQDRPEQMRIVLEPLFAPRTERYFTMHNIDNLLLLRTDDRQETEKAEKHAISPDFRYEDEILEEKIGHNFGRMFYELCDQLIKWKHLTLREYNGILEIKFGKEIYENRDYYAFLAHLSGKKVYDCTEMLTKPETMIEELAAENLTDDEKNRIAPVRFEITFGDEELSLSPQFAEEGSAPPFFVTDMTFDRIIPADTIEETKHGTAKS